MGFYYDKNSDQERMISKFDKLNRNNKVSKTDQNHPDFEPTSLSLKDQFKYWENKRLEEGKKPKQITKIEERRITLRK